MGNSLSSATESGSTISIPRGLIDANELFLLETRHIIKSNSTEDADVIVDTTPLDNLIAAFADVKYSHPRAFHILRSTSAVASTISSSIFIWMILRSHDRLSTTQHRLLLGLCISDFFYSLSLSTFNVMSPSELDYILWNARGNQDTCTVQGFFVVLGSIGGLFYNASLNLYFLAVIKFKKSDEFIRAKIEPFLHGLPIAVSLSYSITRIVKGQYNADPFGACISFENDLPHCKGYDVGEVPDEFEIPCHRGSEGAATMGTIRIVLLFIPIGIMIIALGIIYRVVRSQERRLSKYGVGALKINLQSAAAATGTPPQDAQQQRSTAWGRMGMSLAAMVNSFKSCTWPSCKKNPNEPAIRSNNIQSQSRAVMHKAFGYTFAWFMSYGFYLTALIRILATSKFNIVLGYIATIFLPLQGLFNLLIFLYPKIKAAKKSKRGGETVSLCQAFSTALKSRGKSRKKQTPRKSKLRGDNRRSNTSTYATQAVTQAESMSTPALRAIKKKTTKKKSDNGTPNEEEKKHEIEMSDSLNANSMTRALYAPASIATYAPNIATSTEQTSTLHEDLPDEVIGMKKKIQDEDTDLGDVSLELNGADSTQN